MVPHLPPEWHRQDWLWIGFPHDAREWPGVLDRAQEQIAGFANCVAESGEAVRLIVRDEANAARARELCSDAVQLEQHDYGDIWLRDTGPLVTLSGKGQRTAQRFGFNGWGGKYQMAGDETIGADLARAAGLSIETHNFVLEGGAVDCDRAGLFVTTEQCLLNPNRNGLVTREQMEAHLAASLGMREILWLGEGLVNDHTDGHVDNLARFVGPRTLLLPQASGPDDPNAHIYADAWARAAAFSDAAREPLILRAMPSPGKVMLDDEVAPASYMNFVITNNVVVVPIYGTPADHNATATLAELLPDRQVIGLLADAVLAGGGGFHCASQQMPRRDLKGRA